MKSPLAVFLTLAVSTVIAPATDWPSWRGPFQNNVSPETNFPTCWSKTEKLRSADGMNPLVYTSPSYGQGTLIVMGGFMGSMMFIKPGGHGDRTEQRLVYERRLKKHVIGSPIVKDGHVYVGITDGFAQCYELSTGRLLWEERLKTSGASSQMWASANLAGDKLYGVNQSGDTIIWRAAPTFEVIATNSVGELSNSTLAMSNGELFLRTHAALYCIANLPAR